MVRYTYLTRLLIALDQLFNTIFGGYPDETFSARCYRLGFLENEKKWFIAMRVVNTMFFSKTHCKEAYENEQLHYQSPEAQR